MAFIDMKRKEIQSKLVYYGPGRGGKTTNVLHLFRTMSKQVCGKMVTIELRPLPGLAAAGSLLGIEILDHLVLGEAGRFVSLHERGVL